MQQSQTDNCSNLELLLQLVPDREPFPCRTDVQREQLVLKSDMKLLHPPPMITIPEGTLVLLPGSHCYLSSLLQGSCQPVSCKPPRRLVAIL